MLGLNNRLNAVFFKTLMRCHTAAFEIYFDKIFGQAYLYLLTDKIKRHRVFVYTV